jgi:CRISPR-associated protein Cst1
MSDTVRYVGDPYVDAGIAVLEHRLEKEHAEFCLTDLSAQAEWLTAEYSRKVWAGYLTVHFPNSGWCNPTMAEENKAAFRQAVLCGFDLPPLDRPCAYCGRSAQELADGSKIPMLTGATSMTSGPGGAPGLPVCGYCLYAIQFYPLATLKVEGKPLFWWTSDSQWQYLLTGEFMATVSRVMAVSTDSFMNVRWPSTRLLDSAWRVLNRVLESGAGLRLADVIGCHATNYRTEPNYEEIHIPRSLLEFWAEAKRFPAYTGIVESSWETRPKAKARRETVASEVPEWQRRNVFYEDLGELIRGSGDQRAAFGFAKKYFGLRGQAANRSFQLTRLFLERMTEMTKDRLDAIERLAHRIADSERWKDSVERLFRARNVTGALVDIQDRLLRAGEAPLTTADVYQAFDIVSAEDATVRDSWFVRDLMLLRVLELKGESAIPDVAPEEA